MKLNGRAEAPDGRRGRTLSPGARGAPDAITSLKPKPQPGPGRPSKAEVIRAAITDYQKTDPGLSRPPSEQYRTYRSYISPQGYKPYRDAGFSNKTFEKYEREFRPKLK